MMLDEITGEKRGKYIKVIPTIKLKKNMKEILRNILSKLSGQILKKNIQNLVSTYILIPDKSLVFGFCFVSF